MTIDPIHVSFLSLFLSSLNIIITLLRDYWYHKNIKATLYLNKGSNPYIIIINRNDHNINILNYVKSARLLDTKQEIDFIHGIDARDSLKITSLGEAFHKGNRIFLYTGDYKKVKVKIVNERI